MSTPFGGQLRCSGFLGLVLLPPCLTLPARALACVVGSGTGASCTESALTACLPGGGSFDGAVTFNCGGAATITVTSTKTISADTTIDGGSLITISGGHGVGVFSVNTYFNLTVQNLTIANGSASYGGGIWLNWGTLTVTNSTFSGNSADAGGGILNGGGTLTVTNSTFSGNSASGAYGQGGGIYNYGNSSITNSTFSGNSADAGGGIFNYGGGLTVTNTIVANSPSGGNCADGVIDGGHNIDDGTTCGFTGTGCTITSGSSFCSTNPQLAAGLANNGGPTQTIALQPGSPAINAGDETVCAAPPVNNLDQRGFVRPGTGAANCSIGAFEANSPAPDGTSCTSSGQCSHGNCVDGICCGPACSGICQSCAAAKTGLANGTCGEVTAGLQTTNNCNGTMACNGADTCLLAGGQSCSSGSQCASNSCVASTCLLTNGQTCSTSGQCASNSCVGGTCGAVGVPTLSQWGIILFSCLALAFVLWQTRGRLGVS